MNKLIYQDFAPKAAENAVMSPESGEFSYTVSLIDDSSPVNFASFEDVGINLLDDSLCFASETDNVGFVSAQTSSNNQSFFNDGIRLVFTFEKLYSGPGITLHFHQNYCSKVKIKFFNDSQVVFEGDFSPDSLDYFCEAPAELFNKVVIIFSETETSYQFVKLKGLDFGKTQEIVSFFGSVNIFEEIKIDCSDLPYDTCDFEALIPEEITPQVGQSFYVYHGSECFGKFTAEKISEDTDRRFVFEASDDKAVLKNSPFPDVSKGTYTVNDILSLIYENSDITIDDNGYGNLTLSGFIKSTGDSRYAAEMLSMGSGLFVSSARSKKLQLLKFRDRTGEIITADRILGRAQYIKNAPYTNIKLYEYRGNDFNEGTPTIRVSENKNITANISTNELKLDKFSLFHNAYERLQEIASLGYERNEIRAEIILKDDRIGDIVQIDTPHGIKTGIITSLDINIQGSEITASVVLIETEVK